MNSEVNHNSSSYLSAFHYIKDTGNLGNKLECTSSIHSELVEAPRKLGCSKCIALLGEIVRKHSNTRIDHKSYTCPTLAEIKQERRPGRPRIGRGGK
jgi:hypothetical protein